MSESHPRNCVSKPGRTSFRAGITADWHFQETLVDLFGLVGLAFLALLLIGL
jgi:hypothetical protein